MTGLVPERWSLGWRGPALATLIALLAGLPGLVGMPLLDRDEARTVQATAQMLETGDFVAISFQNQARERQPVGIHWLQAASVAAFSKVEARELWAYRLPSLLGAMLAAWACAWGAIPLFGARAAATAGAALGVSFLLSSAAGIGAHDAVAAGASILALAALGRIHATANGSGAAGRKTRAAFWCGLGLAMLAGGWAPVLIILLAIAALFAVERRADWLRSLSWTWGLIGLAAFLGPWLVAITVTTDGAFWKDGAGESLPLFLRPLQTLGVAMLLFPAVALLPAAALTAWRERKVPAVRWTLAWLAGAWVVFELKPDRGLMEALILCPPILWLAASAWPAARAGRVRLIGAGLSVAIGLLLAAGALALLAWRDSGGDVAMAAVTALFFAGAGGLAAAALWQERPSPFLAMAASLAIAAHAFLAAGLAPGLSPLWPSRTVIAALERSGLDPRDGIAQGPVTVAGYAEPSLIFPLGARTEVGDGEDAAQAILEGRPAVVEAAQEPAFTSALQRTGRHASAVAVIDGVSYADGRPVRLTLWRSQP